ncbi:MAG: Hpt domain-containing protein [Treponema sp.]|nr:Hpt domain-containing protein [Treponema sp.]
MANDAVYVDFAEGAKRVMGNSGLYLRLLCKFREGPGLGPLREAFSSGDCARLVAEAHALRGLCANLSLLELALKCQALEAGAKEGSLDSGAFEKTEAAFAATLAAIERTVAEHA